MEILETDIAGVLLVKPEVHGDERGFFLEHFQVERYAQAGITGPWMQDNLSRSSKGVLRGLHYQHPDAQGKLVSVVAGAVFDVAVDIRKNSPTFGRWYGAELNAENRHQLWVPPGLAHGFVTLSDSADFFYKCSHALYNKSTEHVIRYDDPDIGIVWPVDAPIVNARDAEAPYLKDVTDLPL